MMVKKNILVMIYMIFQIHILSAEAPELKNVMPNSWQRLVRITGSEEKEFLQATNKFFDEQIKQLKNIGKDEDNSLLLPNYIKVYKEVFGKDTFYRIIFCGEDNPDYLSKNIQFSQVLIYKNTLLAACSYNYKIKRIDNYKGRSLPGRHSAYQSIDIVGTKNRATGVLLTNVYVQIDDKNNFTNLRKGQVYGSNVSVFFDLNEFASSGSRLLTFFPLRYTSHNSPINVCILSLPIV